ncbi:hypothetical protein ACFV2U_40155, partial [Streptomyces sp. NPDC059697]
METGEQDHGQRPWRERPVGRSAVVRLLAGMVGLAVLGIVFVVLPGVVVDHDLAGAVVVPQDRLKAVNDVRTTLLQMIGGLVVLFGAYATWRQLRVSQDGLRASVMRPKSRELVVPGCVAGRSDLGEVVGEGVE